MGLKLTDLFMSDSIHRKPESYFSEKSECDCGNTLSIQTNILYDLSTSLTSLNQGVTSNVAFIHKNIDCILQWRSPVDQNGYSRRPTR